MMFELISRISSNFTNHSIITHIYLIHHYSIHHSFIDDQAAAGIFNEISMAIPGIDEAMSFGEVMKLVNSLDYSVIVFDTAPTGHTLRFLSFPTAIEKALGKLGELGGRFGPMMQQMMGMFGGAGAGASFSQEELFGKMESTRQIVAEVNKQFQDPNKTTFICVCIAEFLSVYETERMIQELTNFNIDTHNIVVNQLLLLSGNGGQVSSSNCEHCAARRKMQQKYLDQVLDLYEDFHVVQLPLLTREVRGPSEIESFSNNLIVPYNGSR